MPHRPPDPPHRRPRLVVTPEALRQAWDRLRRQQRHLDDWPPTYDEVIAQPLLRAVVRAEALRHAQAASGPRRPEVSRWRAPAPGSSLRFDPRRAAANDLDDDDDDDTSLPPQPPKPDPAP